ncbi:MAG: hypothetical protein ACTSQK_07795 [Candidatus Heimdallarchaeota archaeon]
MYFPTKTKKAFLLTTFIGSLLFLLLTIIAMIVYSGGTFNNPTSTSYNFLENYFSDLGRAETFLGDSNIVSRILFACALTIVAVSLVFYFITLPSFFKENKVAKWFIIIGSINGVLSAIAYALIGYLPYDIYGKLHTNMVYVAFSASLLTLIVYIVGIFLEKSYPNAYAWAYVIFTLVLVVYLYILFAGPSSGTDLGKLIQVVGQKVIVYTEIISFAIQGLGAWFLLRKSETPAINIEPLKVEITKE